MALQAGAKRVVAVEGNPRHFLKCLIVKSMLRMDAADFRLGEFGAMLQTESDEYDLVLAQGVLYHMVDPVELIALTAARARRLARFSPRQAWRRRSAWVGAVGDGAVADGGDAHGLVGVGQLVHDAVGADAQRA